MILVEKVQMVEEMPKDFVWAYKEVSKMALRNGIRLIIHIADAPAHYRKYSFDYQDSENYEEEHEKILTFIKKICRRRIKIIGFDINNACRKCFERMKEWEKIC